MPKPIILAVDDDEPVLVSVERDLRSRYGADHRVIGAGSGEAALEAIGKLRLRGTPVALVLADQRMPEMTGIELLERVVELDPEAKRVLLTAYADTDIAIRAINEANLDYYLLKPWDPPEERLYPALGELLDDWWAAYRPPFEGIRVLGHRWSRVAHEIRSFLVRNLIPYEWADPAHDPQAAQVLAQAGLDGGQLPVVVLSDGDLLARPSPAELAERVGLHTRAELPSYDLVIVGTGPAGLAAAVYGASEGLKTVVVDNLAAGGQAGTSARIENYLGFPRGLSGAELTRRTVAQARRFGAEMLVPVEAASLQTRDGYKIVGLADGSQLNARALIIATGVSYRRLPVAGLDDLVGAGVYYSAARAEAVGHRGEDVFIVGGGNSAGQAAMFLSMFARSVTFLVRSRDLSGAMSRYLIDQIESADNIAVRGHTGVVGVKGGDRLESVAVADTEDGAHETLPAGALFIFIGMAPATDWLAGTVARDEKGFVLSGADCGPRPSGWTDDRPPMPLETTVPGVFAAGDVRHGSVKRIAAAAGEGAMAVRFCHEYLAAR
ncbi:FAD-dependent oxidoreductase [soil metagenome]